MPKDQKPMVTATTRTLPWIKEIFSRKPCCFSLGTLGQPPMGKWCGLASNTLYCYETGVELLDMDLICLFYKVFNYALTIFWLYIVEKGRGSFIKIVGFYKNIVKMPVP